MIPLTQIMKTIFAESAFQRIPAKQDHPVQAVLSIYSSASPMGRKSALRREIPWILRGFQGRLSC